MDTLCQNRQIENTHKLRLLKLIPFGCMHVHGTNVEPAGIQSSLTSKDGGRLGLEGAMAPPIFFFFLN